MTYRELHDARVTIASQAPRPMMDKVAAVIVLAVQEGLAIDQNGVTWEDVLTMVRAELYNL